MTVWWVCVWVQIGITLRQYNILYVLFTVIRYMSTLLLSLNDRLALHLNFILNYFKCATYFVHRRRRRPKIQKRIIQFCAASNTFYEMQSTEMVKKCLPIVFYCIHCVHSKQNIIICIAYTLDVHWWCVFVACHTFYIVVILNADLVHSLNIILE